MNLEFPEDFIRTGIYDEYSGLMKITTHLDHISHCKTVSGTNWSNRWTYRVFIINTRRDEIGRESVFIEEVLLNGTA
jgi:hypothetical protein